MEKISDLSEMICDEILDSEMLDVNENNAWYESERYITLSEAHVVKWNVGTY